jgi:Cohesin domain/Carboxypeptidase regulatory-like domain
MSISSNSRDCGFSSPMRVRIFTLFSLFLFAAVLNAAAAVLTVNPLNSQGFQAQTGICGGTNTQDGQFANGPMTAPLGVGSFRMTVGSDGDSVYIYRNAAFDGVPLSSLTALSYSTYVTHHFDSQAIALNLRVDTNNDGVYDPDVDDTLWFEPAYEGPGYFPANPQGPLTVGAWQNWDAFHGGWYTDQGAAGSGPGSNVKSFAAIVAALPGAKIVSSSGFGGLRLFAGCGAGSWDNFDGNVDNLTVGVSGANTTYNFEPLTTVVVDADGKASLTDCNAPDATYSDIQSAIDAVVGGYTVKVCPGTYTQAGSISLNKAIDLQGPNSSISPNGGARGPEAIITGPASTILRISAPGSPSTIEGFKFDSTGVVDAYDPGLNITIRKNIFSNGTSAGTLYFLNAPPQLTLDDNHLTNAVAPNNDAIFVAGDWNGTTGTAATITNNVVDNTGTAASSGMNLSNVSGIISGNKFTNLLQYAILLANNSSSMTISNNTFDGMVNPDTTVPTWGSGVRTYTPSFTGPVNITGNTFKNSYAGVGIRGVPNDGGASIAGMDIHVNFNRFFNNTYGISDGAAGTLDAKNNWWGCNYGPGAGGAGCSGTANGIHLNGTAAVDASTWLKLTTSASPSQVVIGGTSTVTSLLRLNNNNVTPGGGTVQDGIPATFTGTRGTTTPSSSTLVSGSTGTVFTGTAYGNGAAATTVDGQTVSAPIDAQPVCADVSTPSFSSLTGADIVIPVNTTDLTTRGAMSADFRFTYNTSVLDSNPAHISVTAGTVVSPTAVVSINTSTAGLVIVSIFDQVPFTGSGTVADLHFKTIGNPATSSPLTLSPFSYNEGSPCVNISSGTLSIISGTIAGTVSYGNVVGSPAAPRHVRNVSLTAAGSIGQSTTTDTAGAYSFSGLGAGPYTITPTKTGGDLGAISGLDAAYVAQFVVGITPGSLINATQQSVADVSASGTITSYDASLIARFAAGLPNAGLSGTWKFNPVNRTYPNVNTNMTGQDYTALLMGDVTGNWFDATATRPAIMTYSEKPMSVKLPVTAVSRGTEISVPVTISNSTGKGILSYEFAVAYDPAVIEPLGAATDMAETLSSGMNVTTNTTEPGVMRVVVFGTQVLSGPGQLLNLKFRVLGEVGTSTDLTWNAFRFNEGDVYIETTNGHLDVSSANANDTAISGRLLTGMGAGIPNTRIVLTDASGESRSTLSNGFGNYSFGSLQAGQTYTLKAESKQYRFQPLTVSPSQGETINADMIETP